MEKCRREALCLIFEHFWYRSTKEFQSGSVQQLPLFEQRYDHGHLGFETTSQTTLGSLLTVASTYRYRSQYLAFGTGKSYHILAAYQFSNIYQHNFSCCCCCCCQLYALIQFWKCKWAIITAIR
jgi:hypothetical protein